MCPPLTQTQTQRKQQYMPLLHTKFRKGCSSFSYYTVDTLHLYIFFEEYLYLDLSNKTLEKY